jgi:hypothetical protein
VYTAIEAKLDRDADEATAAEKLAACHAELSQLLPHLAQLHPRHHPGELEGGLTCRLAINNEQLCVVDQSGAAHASILQEPASEYSRNRLRRIQMEYFPGFLLAVIQRLCLQRILNDSTEASALPPEQQDAARQNLLEKVLRFGLEGEFVQVAWRSTVQKHHETAQQAFEVHEGLSTVRHAMQDFGRMAALREAERQRIASEEAAEKRYEETERAEWTMRVLETFIVTFYSVELANILGEAFEFGHTPFLGWSLIAVAFLSFVMGALLVSWRWLRKQHGYWTIGTLFLMASAIHAAFLGANWWHSRSTRSLPPTRSEAPQDGGASQNSHHP